MSTTMTRYRIVSVGPNNEHVPGVECETTDECREWVNKFNPKWRHFIERIERSIMYEVFAEEPTAEGVTA